MYKKIAFVCSTAVSSNLLKRELMIEIENQNLNYEILAIKVDSCANIANKYDLVVLMPHIRYNFKKIENLATPTKVIILDDYLYTNHDITGIINLVKDII